MSVKFVLGIGSAPPPPCALAAPAQHKIASRVTAHIFNIILSSMLPKDRLPTDVLSVISNAYLQPINQPRARPRRETESMAEVVGKSPLTLVRATAIGAALSFAFAGKPAQAAPEIGKAAPELVVTELDGQTFDLAKLRGKVVLVSYWATWCAPCRKDMPKLDALYRRYHDDNLEIIGISIDRDSDLEKVRKVAPKLAYPVALLKGITNDGFGPPAGVPITWIVDADGKVSDMMIDVRDELLNSLVLPLLPHAH